MSEINRTTLSIKPNTDPTNGDSCLNIARRFGRHLVNMCGDHNTCGWTSILYQTHPKFQKTLEHSRKCSKLLPVFETRKALFDQINDKSAKFVPDSEQPLQGPQKKTTHLLSRIHNVCSELYTIPDGTQAFSALIDHIYHLSQTNSLPSELSTKLVEILSTFTPSEHLTEMLKEALTHKVIDKDFYIKFLSALQSPATDPVEIFQIIFESCEQIREFVNPYLAGILESFEGREEESGYTKKDLEKQQEAFTRFHKVFCAPEVGSFEEMKIFLHEHLKPLYQLIESINQFLTEIDTEKTNFMRLLDEIGVLKTAIPGKLKQQSLGKKTALTQEEIDFLHMDNEFLPIISQFLRKTIVLVECYSEGRGFEIFFPNNKQLSIQAEDFKWSWEEFCRSRHWDEWIEKFNPKKKIKDILGELLKDPKTIGLFHEGRDHYQALASVH